MYTRMDQKLWAGEEGCFFFLVRAKPFFSFNLFLYKLKPYGPIGVHYLFTSGPVLIIASYHHRPLKNKRKQDVDIIH